MVRVLRSPKWIASTLYQVYEALANLLRSVNQNVQESSFSAPSYTHAAGLWKNDHVKCSSGYNSLMVACCLRMAHETGFRNTDTEEGTRAGDIIQGIQVSNVQKNKTRMSGEQMRLY